jgi:hypothetical protein
MQIAATQENMKAAFILSKNNLDINEANLQAVKEIDAKINAIANSLHPLIAATMLKEGLSPLDIHADQLLAYIKQFNLDMGQDGRERIARHIMEMDESRSIDADTRKSMIAVYRTLHVIQKDGAAALGLAMRMDVPLTLGHLMDAAQNYMRQRTGTGFERRVDDDFGVLEALARPEGSIRAALERTPPAAVGHTDLLVDSFIRAAKPAALQAMLSNESSVLNEPLEDVTENANMQSEPPQPVETDMMRMREILAVPPEVLFFAQNPGAPAPMQAPRPPQSRSSQAFSKIMEMMEETDTDETETKEEPIYNRL